MRYRRSLPILLIAAAVSCAPPPAATTKAGRIRDPNIISAEELRQTLESNAYDVIGKLRPKFLHSQGRSSVLTQEVDYPAVFLDNQYYGDLNSLKTIPATSLLEIRYYPPTDVATKFGMQYNSGVIAVRTR